MHYRLRNQTKYPVTSKALSCNLNFMGEQKILWNGFLPKLSLQMMVNLQLPTRLIKLILFLKFRSPMRDSQGYCRRLEEQLSSSKTLSLYFCTCLPLQWYIWYSWCPSSGLNYLFHVALEFQYWQQPTYCDTSRSRSKTLWWWPSICTGQDIVWKCCINHSLIWQSDWGTVWPQWDSIYAQCSTIPLSSSLTARKTGTTRSCRFKEQVYMQVLWCQRALDDRHYLREFRVVECQNPQQNITPISFTRWAKWKQNWKRGFFMGNCYKISRIKCQVH